MNLSEYLPIINNTMPLYLNAEGLITTDTKHHINIFKATLIHYWKRFMKLVDYDQLWSFLQSFNSDSNFQFNTDGTPFNPPFPIVYLIRKERERNILMDIKGGDDKKTNDNNKIISPKYSIFIITICCLISIIYYIASIVDFNKIFNKTTKLKSNLTKNIKSRLEPLYNSFVTMQK